MFVLNSLFALWLFHSVSCQTYLESQGVRRRFGCDIVTNGLAGDTECALASARAVFPGYQGELTFDDLNLLCGATACAELLEFSPVCVGIDLDERSRVVMCIYFSCLFRHIKYL